MFADSPAPLAQGLQALRVVVVADEALGAFPPTARVVDGAVSYALPVD